MDIRNIVHKGLRRFIERDDASGLPPASVERIRNMVGYLLAMDHTDELTAFPHWRPHRLTGARKGTWALTVTANWRLTFKVDETTHEIMNLDFEDYH